MTETLDARPDEATIRYEVADGVATVTLNRPAKRNALTPAMTDRYVEAIAAADEDPSVRAIVVTGAGHGFCAGADLALLRSGPAGAREFLASARATTEAALRARKPVIAAVNGATVGIGCIPVVTADVRFAAENATFATAFARLGLVAEYNIGWLLQRQIGLPATMDLLLSGRAVGAAEAARIGLVQRVVPAGTVLDEALAYARDLAANCSPRSMATIKAQVYADAERGREAAMTSCAVLMEASFTWPDLPGALDAQAAKRPPAHPPLPPGPVAV
jgi:enoyl-CoA hydratase/carnithine racemase